MSVRTSASGCPDIRKLLDKQVLIQVGGTRKVKGLLRGFDPFMNLVSSDYGKNKCFELILVS